MDVSGSNLFPVLVHFGFHPFATSQAGKETDPAKEIKEITFNEKVNEISAVKEALKYLDADFFSDSKVGVYFSTFYFVVVQVTL